MQVLKTEHVMKRVFWVWDLWHIFHIYLGDPWALTTNYTILDGWYSFAFMSIENRGPLDEYALILHGLLWLASINMRAEDDTLDRNLWTEHHTPTNKLLLLPLIFDLRNIKALVPLFFFGTYHDDRCAGWYLWDVYHSFFSIEFLVTSLAIRGTQSSPLFEYWGLILQK